MPTVTPPAAIATEHSSIPVGFRGTGQARDAQFPPKVTAPPVSNSASVLGNAAGPGLQVGVNIIVGAGLSIAVIAPKALAGGGTAFAGATAHCIGFAVPTVAQPMASIAPPSAFSLAVIGDPTTEVAGDVFPGATGFALGNAGNPIIESGTPGEVDPTPAVTIAAVAPATSPSAGATISPSASEGWAEAPATTANAGSAGNASGATASVIAIAPRPTISVVANLRPTSGEATCVAPLTGVTIVRPWTESASLGFVPVVDQD